MSLKENPPGQSGVEELTLLEAVDSWDRITGGPGIGLEHETRHAPGQSGVTELDLDEHVDMWHRMLASYEKPKE